jgi:hypothetical protein
MKAVLVRFSFLPLIASANASQKLVRVGDLTIAHQYGCGAPPPPGTTCSSDSYTLSFVVPTGGSCHTYSAKIKTGENVNVLEIIDTEQNVCTRPEQMDYPVTVTLQNPIFNGPLMLANEVYIHQQPRPSVPLPAPSPVTAPAPGSPQPL